MPLVSSLVTDILWLFYCFADFTAKCLLPPILGRFLGVWPPKCSRILWRPPKAHPWPETRNVYFWTPLVFASNFTDRFSTGGTIKKCKITSNGIM